MKREIMEKAKNLKIKTHPKFEVLWVSFFFS